MTPRPSWWPRVVVAAAVAVLVLGGVAAWDWHRRPARIAAALPIMPDAARLPGALLERLQQAEHATRDRASALDGVAELGSLYQANGYVDEASACWMLLRAEQPREGRWSYFLAEGCRTRHDDDGAVAHLEETTRLSPDYAPAWLRLAELRFKRGQPDAAERAYRRRLELIPGDPYALLGVARVAWSQGRPDDARAQIERLVADVPDFPPARNLFAELLAAAGDETRAARERLRGSEAGRFREADDPWLDELLDACLDNDRLCVRGMTDALTGRAARGGALLERAVRLHPGRFTAYELLGNLYLDSNDAARARETYETGLRQAVGAQPSAKFYANLSRACRRLDQPAEAIRIAREGLARTGESPELYDALADALVAGGQPEAAVEGLRSAVALAPDDAQLGYKLAVALLAVHRLDDAVATLHRAHAAQPTHPATLALLAQIEIDSGRWQGAVRYLQPIYELHPELPDARDKMVFCYLRAGLEAEQARDAASAERHFRAGLAIQPEHTELSVRLGAMLLIQRRFSDALPPLEAYHRVQPDNPQSALFLGQAYFAVGRRDDARRLLTLGAELAERTGQLATAQRCREMLARLQ